MATYLPPFEDSLPWSDTDNDRKFILYLAAYFTIVVVAFVVLRIITLPRLDEQKRNIVVLQPIKLKPRAPLPTPPPEITPPKETPKPPPKLTKAEESARKKAEQKLKNVTQQLEGLKNIADDAKKMVNQTLHSSVAGSRAATIDSNILMAKASTGSGGVGDNRYVATVQQTTLEQGQGVDSKLPVDASGGKKTNTAGVQKGKSGGLGVRAEEDITYVIDQNKGVLQALYRKARRSNPGLKGKIVFEITVDASGKVVKIIVKSSELHDPALEESIISRIRLFDFGVRKGGPLTISFPLEFVET